VRSARLGTILLVLATGACAGRATSPAAAAAAVAPATDSMAPHSAAEEAARYALTSELRARIHRATVWENPGKGAPCDPGVLRTFRDDSAHTFAQIDSVIRRLERTIIVMGVDQPIDTPAGHDLMRTVLAWEAGEERPRWDVPAGQAPERVMPAGLTGEFFNEEKKRCEPLAATDTVTMVMPTMRGFVAPTSLKTAQAVLFQGDSAVQRARDAFFAARGTDTTAVFLYTQVTTLVLWREYAVVAVNRPAEKQAVVRLQKGVGGATYIFRREKNEWRLLVIARTWS
jgi:hypothetical protein